MMYPFQNTPKFSFIIGLALLIPAIGGAVARGATSVSQFGITWKFDSDHPVGQFVNGDYWVVGPVTIVGISPADPLPKDGVDLHGSVINPLPETSAPYHQSWDSRIENSTTYDRSRNVARQLPLRVANGSSLVSVRSYPLLPDRKSLWLSDAAVLTVLPSAPPPGSFRPPYAGTDKSIPGNVADLNLGIFRSLPPVRNTPALSSFDGVLDQPMLDVIGQWQNSAVKNAGAGPNYGRDIARQVGDVVLTLNLNHSAEEKLPLFIRLVQRGIDTYGLARSGMVWFPNGGHNTGRKLPLLIAGKALGRPDMLEWADGEKHFIFQEDMQHWYITQEDVDTPRLKGQQPYTTNMIGLPEWASNPITERTQSGAQWGKAYRIVNGVADTGLVLAAELMGLRDAWNWKPLFDYIDHRFWPIEGPTPSSSQRIPVYHRNMWLAYQSLEPAAITTGNIASTVSENIGLPSQTDSFTVAFDTIASATHIDGVISLTEGGEAGGDDIIAALRFSPAGQLEALNGSTYQASTRLDYAAGIKYRVVATVDLSSQLYSVTVTPPNAAPVRIADRWQLHTDPGATPEADTLNFVSIGSYHEVIDPIVVPN